MAFDAIVTRAVTRELSGYMTGGKVEKIYQPGDDELVFFIHGSKGRVKIYASSNSNHPGIFLTDLNYENPPLPPAFCMLMRKHLQGSRIVSVKEKDTERIIEIVFESKDEMGYVKDKKLICEIMGKHSNIILLDINSNKIIDSIKRVSFDESRIRQIFPGQEYSYPHKQEKIPFDEATLDDITDLIGSGENIDDRILSNIGGISPAIARMIAESGNPAKIYDKLKSVKKDLENSKIYPTVYITEEQAPKDFHVLKLPEYEDRFSCLTFEKVSECIQWFYSNREQSNRIKQKSQNLSKSVAGMLKKLRLKTQRLKEDILKAENGEKYRLYGELITANIHLMKTGDKSVTLENYYDGTPVTIPLDVRYAPSKNAQLYFKKYGKSKTALVEKKKQLDETAHDILYLESVEAYIQNSVTVEELDTLRTELEDSGFLRARKVKGKKKVIKNKPFKYITSSGFRVSVGRNNKENDELTLKKAGKNDIWLHTKDIPGAHAILFTEDKEVPDADIIEAANIAAWHSNGRKSENVPVDHTRVRYVKKPSGAKPGMVIFTNNKTCYLTPVNPENFLDKEK